MTKLKCNWVYDGHDNHKNEDDYVCRTCGDYISVATYNNPSEWDKYCEFKCSTHPDAPHGFNRNASHNAGRYVCDCEGWSPE